MQSRENRQKPQFGQFFDDFEVNISKLQIFLKKQVSFKLKVIFSTNFRPKTKKVFKVVFEKNIKVSDFGLIWRPFREYLQIKIFFQKSGSVTFLPLQSPKTRKILSVVSEKTALPTNQPTNYYQQHRSYRTSLTPVQLSEIISFSENVFRLDFIVPFNA